jgi:tetratricopeptide (TPR) repeat protein
MSSRMFAPVVILSFIFLASGWHGAKAADQAAINAKKEEIHRCLLNCYRQMGRIKDSEEECKILIALRPDDGLLRYEMGDFLLKSGRVGESLSHFKKAAQLDPSKGEFHAAVGSILLSQKDYNGAVSAYRSAVSCAGGARFMPALQTAMTYQANQTQRVQYHEQLKKKADDDE